MSERSSAASPGPAGVDASSGLDLHDSDAALALRNAAAEPEEAMVKGVEIVDTRNWRDVRARAEQLLQQSKDLRTAVILVRALLHTEGLHGLAQGLGLVRSLVEQYWPGLHPIDDDGGSTARLNVLLELWSMAFLLALRATTVVSVRNAGSVAVRDVLLAKGFDKPRAGTTPANPHVVLRMLSEAPEAAGVARAVRLAHSELEALETFFIQAKIPGGIAPDPLRQILRVLGEALPQGNGQAVAEQAQEASAANGQPEARERSEATMVSPQVHSASDSQVLYRERELESRDDVVRLIDRICTYYDRHEPSSPIPLLLQRARRLVTMNFVELIKELADKGMPQIEAITGKEPKS